ncbi:hypothetical protein PISMIDRAFT_18438 [Pisolithus microcarpus 441]|uniref:Uncharacterized protein n=1 Tax=Pisolithus microcarpus 441 TaxID=765257 RepID=A0A0C9YR44_9AGAM|nr:hypothetical protein PISMIDRAFT_18438 [Pisolithus microcarpus 441]
MTNTWAREASIGTGDRKASYNVVWKRHALFSQFSESPLITSTLSGPSGNHVFRTAESITSARL